MPYISPARRERLDKDQSILDGWPGDGLLNSGELTYVLQQVIRNFIIDHGMEYRTFTAVLGSLEGCRADFIDRVLTPYEQGKRIENGDVWGTLGECR